MPYPLSGYSVGGAQTQISSKGGSTETDDKPGGYWSLAKMRRAYLDYLGTKREEIDEQQDARRIMHGSQWTQEQIRNLNLRRQPVTTNNQVARKIHGVVGTLERLRQDPKAYARTPKHEQGAELATGALRYALEAQNWSAKDPICSEMAAIDGIAGLEFNLVEGDRGDIEVEMEVLFTDSFFYDPRSYRHDFSDARFMGVGKWMDLDAAIELYPDYEQELEDSIEVGDDLSSEPDREFKWFHSHGQIRRVRVVDFWYKHKGEWCYCVFTGNTKLMEDKSYLTDEKGKGVSKYEMFSCYVDQDGDRYGLIRNLKPLQQQINMRESKVLYNMTSRRLKAEKGAFDDVEVARREGHRSDGVVIYNKGFEAEFDDAARQQETEAQFKFLELTQKNFDAFGPNVSLLGQGLENASGRAINLLQQAGLADLGAFIQSYRGWKIRVYRKMWNAIQKHWQGERWIRVTDDDDLSNFIQVNGMDVDPMTGMPVMVNAIGSLDVDIILDEGPDAVNQMADAYDALSVLVQGGTQIPPMVLIELAPIPNSVKNKIKEIMSPAEPTPEMQINQQRAIEEVKQIAADAKLKEAQAVKALSDAQRPDQINEGDDPRKVEMELAEKAASIEKTMAEKAKIQMEMELEPQKIALEQQNKAQDREMKARDSQEKANTDRMGIAQEGQNSQVQELGKALVQSAQVSAKSLDKAADALAKASDNMVVAANKVADNVVAQSIRAPRRLVRDPKTGRATGSEVIE
jgi:hypothetical protein